VSSNFIFGVLPLPLPAMPSQDDGPLDEGLTPNASEKEENGSEKKEKKKKRRSDSSSSRGEVRGKRKKQQSAAFSNFSSFDQGGGAFTGKSYEEKTAEEKLEEMLHGPMTDTARDDRFRREAKLQKEKDGSSGWNAHGSSGGFGGKDKGSGKGSGKSSRPTPPPMQRSTPLISSAAPASGSTPRFLKPGDAVVVYGLTSEAGQKLNGKSGVITKYVEESGRFVVELTKGMSSVHSLKRENVRSDDAPQASGI